MLNSASRQIEQETNMANIKSQKKRIKTNERRRLRNKAVRSEVKTYVRKFEEALAQDNKDEAAKVLGAAGQKLDIAVSKGVLHRNNAANRKSSLARRLKTSGN